MPSAGDADRSREVERRKQAEDARPRMNLQQIQSWVDLEIQQAQRRGDFENLPGAGKPLKDLDKADPDWWIKGLIEREKLDLSAALPTVMALRQERRGYPESLAGIADEVAVRERLADYNARVLEDRRKPVVGPHSPAIAGRVDVEEMVAQWRELRADRARRLADAEPETVEPGDEETHGGLGRGERPSFLMVALIAVVIVAVVIVAVVIWQLF